MRQNDPPTTDQIRRAIEARIDRTLALEELSWRLHAFIEDLWGALPEAWSTDMAELGARLSHGESRSGESAIAAWESGRAEVLERLTPDERWLVGLSEHLWEHAFDGAREAIRAAAVDSFLEATLRYISANPGVPAATPPDRPDAEAVAGAASAVDESEVTKLG